MFKMLIADVFNDHKLVDKFKESGRGIYELLKAYFSDFCKREHRERVLERSPALVTDEFQTTYMLYFTICENS